MAKDLKSSPVDSIAISISNYQYNKALDLIARQLAVDSASAGLYQLQGNVYRQMYVFDKAIVSYQKAMLLDSANNQSTIELANTYKIIQKYREAQTYYRQALSRDTANFFLKIELANCQYFNATENGEITNPIEYLNAINTWLELYQCDSTHYYTVKRLAQSFAKLDVNQAIRFYQRAIELQPLDINNIMAISNLYIAQKQYVNGIQLTSAFMQRDSTCEKINAMNGYLLMLNKQYPAAIESFKACYVKGDSSRMVVKNLGISYYNDFEYDSAIVYLEKAYYQDTTDINNLDVLGLACVGAYQSKQGVTYLEKAIDCFDASIKQYTLVYSHLATACHHWEECPSEKRLAVYHKVAQLKPDDQMVNLLLAYEYDAQKDYNKAIRYYKLYLKSKPKDDEMSEVKVAAYQQLEERVKLLQSYLREGVASN
jgi:tetratricopeptide (TPR) repeat protein